MTVIGLLALCVVALITRKKPQKFGNSLFLIVPGNWGGINLGPVFFRAGSHTEYNKYYDYDCMMHEAGHGVQNMMFGPLFPLIVALPSVWRAFIWGYNYEKMNALTTLLVIGVELVLILAAITCSLYPVVHWLMWVCIAVIIYVICFGVFFFAHELPKHKDNKYVDYYEVWFEGQATALGTKYFKDEAEEYKVKKLSSTLEIK